ncbi:ATP-binding cassette domain-containing protein [Alphaproteobacteria bacterium]|nr:ATP-binding cassette domain-containing protein [Alphaproteobacteria bacterium]
MLPPLLTLANAGINLGDRWLLRGADLSLHAGDRLALVGRNGAGKSSLMKLMSGGGEMDEGSLWTAPGAEIAYLPQAPNIPSGMSLISLVTEGMETDIGAQAHKAEAILMRMGLDGNRMSDGLSGGEARRVSLARALYTEPDILLLDEPTNHMDLPTIEWMEGMLRQHKGALLVVSHDRAFLRNLGTGIVWLHDGKLRRRDGHFSEFDEWSEGILADEAVTLHKMDRRIASETKWSREGISARRKRNQGRLRELHSLRAERAKAGGITSRTVKMETGPAEGGGQLVLEAIDITASVPAPDASMHSSASSAHTLDEAGRRILMRHFNLLIRRSDRIGIVGPNGIGKSTLVRILLGIGKPDAGRVREGFGLNHAYFDQRREALDREASPWTVLSEGGSDMIEVAGQQKHITSYLRDFMFEDVKMTQRVATLSGGEQNRLLLAKLFASPHNFLVLDEPTNDLDLETLELLQEVIADYDGTVLIVSHDRDFLDRTVTGLLAFEGDGKIVAHAGGYSDYLERRKRADERAETRAEKGTKNTKAGKNKASKPMSENNNIRAPRLSFKDKHALETLPDEIAALENNISKLEAVLADPDLFAKDPDRFTRSADEIAALRSEKDDKELAWLAAAEKAEALEGG